MALSPPPQRRRGWIFFWIVLTLVAILAVRYYFLGPGTNGPLIPRLGI